VPALSPRCARVDAAAWGAALFLTLCAAKGALLALRVLDGAGDACASVWLPLALVAEDARLTGAFVVLAALAQALAHRAPRAAPAADRAVAVLYAALAFWAAFNVPVARVLSTPMTSAFVHAMGAELGDSVARYLTPLNLLLPLGLWLAALALPRGLAGRLPRGPRATAAAALAVGAIIALGPTAVARADVSGWHRDAALTFLETALASGTRPPPSPALSSARCRPVDDPGAADLGALAGSARGRNVVWVILESTGARSLSIYGAPRDVTPHLSALAAGPSVVFESAYAAYPESIKSLFSMLCAREPPPGSEASDFGVGREPCTPAAAAALARAGYRTGLFHSGWFAYLGMDAVVRDRGFATLVDASSIPSPYRSSFGVDDRATAHRLLEFVDEAPAKPFFAVFMPIAGHHPYHAPGAAPRPLSEASDHDAYLNDLAVADEAFGALREGLRARGLDERTAYIVVGDHGEAFREHPGNVAHALFVFEENVRVPFVIALPGAPFAALRAPQLASLVDLLPTTLALVGAPADTAHSGRQLLRPGAPRVARFFTEQGVRRRGLRDGRWKTILDADTGRAALYDLATDPAERVDRAAESPWVVARHRACL
jgi:phosphoglycerol transferase MdoB-like AlkP superfamily enzyme